MNAKFLAGFFLKNRIFSYSKKLCLKTLRFYARKSVKFLDTILAYREKTAFFKKKAVKNFAEEFNIKILSQ